MGRNLTTGDSVSSDPSKDDELDPYAMPLPVALSLQVVMTGLLWHWRLRRKQPLTPQQEHVFHGLWMFVVSLLAGLLIPHVARPRSMLSLHSVGCLQAACLLGFAAVWPMIYSAKEGRRVAWVNLAGMWGNVAGFAYSAVSNTQCLLYWTKRENPALHAVGSLAETVLEILLKGQSTFNMVGLMLMAHAFLGREDEEAKDRDEKESKKEK